ncbi:MAG: ATP-binding protein [Pseudomonadota bacterium]
MLRRKLYLQIYLTIIISLVLVVILGATAYTLTGRDRPDRAVLGVVSELAVLTLPEASAPRSEQQRAVRRLGEKLGMPIALFDSNRIQIAAYGRMLPPPREVRPNGQHRIHRAEGWILKLPDGRWFAADPGNRPGPRPLIDLAVLLSSIALGVGLGAYPFVRRLTRRLEALQHGVETMGAGDFSTQVEVRGKDEIAALATSFNEASQKIATLVGAHRMLLANASHELRTPLSRIRLGVELLQTGPDPARQEALEQDIAELDALIDEILLMSRLDADAHPDLSQTVDLLGLSAEECAHYRDCTLAGRASPIRGDPRLLRRLIRNLLENANRHGAPPVEVALYETPDEVILTVTDHGPGIPDAERDQVFQPFYRASGRQNVKGYGLGLALVRQIATAHGGSVVIGPGPSGGTLVYVRLSRLTH